jgi:subtilisin family serine protease
MKRGLAILVTGALSAATVLVGAPAASAVTTHVVTMDCMPAISPAPVTELAVGAGDIVRVDGGDCTRVTADDTLATADASEPLVFTVTAAGASGSHAAVFTGEAADGTVAYAVDFTAATPKAAPSAPSAPTAVSGVSGGQAGSVDLTITTAADGGPVDEFLVQYRVSPSGDWTDATSGSPFASTTITVTGLVPGQAYDFQVAARNAAATSAFVATPTAVVAAATPDGTPPAPESVEGVRGEVPGSIDLTVRPGADGGVLDEYLVQYRVTMSKEWVDYVTDAPLTSTAIVLKALTPGTVYDIRVAARNDIGASNFTQTRKPVVARRDSSASISNAPDTERRKPASIEPSLLSRQPGPVSVMLELAPAPATVAYAAAADQGAVAANEAGREQVGQVEAAQAVVHAALLEPATRADVIFDVSKAYSGIAVSTDTSRLAALAQVAGVVAIHRLVPKAPSNFVTVPLVKAPEAWESTGDFTGSDVTVGIIDTGIDYTHADFGGPGTEQAFSDAQVLADPWAAPAALIDASKVAGGYDFAGDAYDGFTTPQPDANPLDCAGHGTHVSGTTGGYGVNADGSTFTGPWDTTVPFDTMAIGPGVAPEVQLYGLRVFGCDGFTNLVTEALDWAVDPNGDNNFSDHLDVVNMSLGSDYGSAEDPDSVASNNAVDLGVVVVASAGNSGDVYQVSGSPGSAVKAISVAASADSTDVLDGVAVTVDSVTTDYPASQSVAYPWTTQPGVTNGTVVRIGDWSQPPSDANPIDGCSAFTGPQEAAIDGNVVVLAWDASDTTRRCGSAGRTGRVYDAGGTGAILASDLQLIDAGITGSPFIPAVLTTEAGTVALSDALTAGKTVTATLTNALHNSQRIVLSGSQDPTDEMASFTSRGGVQQGNIKPDVSAPGVTIFSAAVGTGDEGVSMSGTSMAAPHVAGLAALAIDAHPTWSPQEIKAAIMNTAGHDLFLGPNHTGPRYDAMRAGSGRIDAKAVVDAQAVMYSTDDPGAVSVSFGVMDVTEATSVIRTVRIADKRTSGSALAYSVSIDMINALGGAQFSVSPDSVTLDPGESADVVVTLAVDPAQLVHKADPTLDLEPLGPGAMRDFLTDVSGLLIATPAGGDGLRLPLIAVPRPASTLAGDSTVSVVGSGATQTGTLALHGGGVATAGSLPYENVDSRVSALELAAVSPALPDCSVVILTGCVAISDDRAADLHYFGVTSDAPITSGARLDPLAPGSPAMAYFGLSTWGPWRTAASVAEFDIYVDTNRDGTPDLVVYNGRYTGTDLLLSVVLSLRPEDGGATVSMLPINNAFGNEDTAKMHSDAMMLPVSLSDLASPPDGMAPFISTDQATVDYWVETYSASMSGVVDSLGSDVSPLTAHLLSPGITALGAAGALPAVVGDGSTLAVTYTAATAVTPGSPKLLLLHHLNATGDRAQVVSVLSTSSPTPGPEPTPTPAPSSSATPITPPKVPTAVVPPTGLTPGQSGLLIDGTATSVSVADGVRGRGVVATGAGLTVAVTAVAPDGTVLPSDLAGALVLAPGGRLRVTGSGFAPGSSLAMTLNSASIPLGSVVVDSSGALTADVAVPADVPVGSHTLTLTGQTRAGAQAILSLGVRVLPAAAAKGVHPVVTVRRPAVIVSGGQFTAVARGVQARCLVTLRVPGAKATSTATGAGRTSALLTAPSVTGQTTVTARVFGPGCERISATTTIRVRRG